jgi:hypothetical protein
MELKEVRYRQRGPGELINSAMNVASIVLESEGVLMARTGHEIGTGERIVMDEIPVDDARKMEEEAEKGNTTTRDKYAVPSTDEKNVYMLKKRSYFEKEQQRGERTVRYSTLITSQRLEEHWNKE